LDGKRSAKADGEAAAEGVKDRSRQAKMAGGQLGAQPEEPDGTPYRRTRRCFNTRSG
jgi:hypothetical protein